MSLQYSSGAANGQVEENVTHSTTLVAHLRNTIHKAVISVRALVHARYPFEARILGYSTPGNESNLETARPRDEILSTLMQPCT
jgi:hypothetical protein